MIGALAQVAGSLATFGAVVVALRLARQERTIRLRVTAGFRTIISQVVEIQVLAVTVENVGHRAAKIELFGWTTGYVRKWIKFPKRFALQSCIQMQDYNWAINERFPWTLEPGQSKSTFIRRTEFVEGFSKHSNGDLFRKLPFAKRWVLFRHRVGVGVATHPQMYFGKVEDSVSSTLEAAYELNQ